MRRVSLLPAAPVSLTLALALLVPSGARADGPPQARMAAQLSRMGAHNPLADGRGRVPVTVRLGDDEDAEALGFLRVAPGIGTRWVPEAELGGFVEAEKARRPWVSPPLHLLMNVSGAQWTHATAAHAAGHTGKGVVVGIIDTGLDLTHPDLRTRDNHTRVSWMLDLASSPQGKHPDLEKKYGCTQNAQAPCAVYTGAELDAAMLDGSQPTDQVGHGTHISSISAGNGGPSSTYVGVAPEAELVVVRVIRQAAGEQITDGDILNAVRFVFDRAESMGMPAVVNISLGGDYGPHDGTSPLETGLASLVGPDKPGHAIVVAAGNSAPILHAASGQEYGAHTETRVVQGSRTRAVLATPSPPLPMQGAAFVWVTFGRGDEVKVGIDMNGATLIDPLSPGSEGAIDAKDGQNPYLAVTNGVLGGGSPLSAPNGAVIAIDGKWRTTDEFAITLEGRGLAQLWVQGTGDAQAESATGGTLFRNPLKQGTINVPASHPDLIAVGCTLNRLSWADVGGEVVGVARVGALENPPGDTACYFSSAGPNALGVPKPEISAPGGFVAAAMSVSANPKNNARSMFVAPADRCPTAGVPCYVVDDQHAVASGTSMSAPHVTGAIALLFEQKPDLTQPELVHVLQAGSRRFRGIIPLEYQVGPGALDVTGSLAVLSELMAPASRGVSPDPARSWIHASSGFARPDGAFPITITVALRGPDDAVADVIDPQGFSLELENAVVLSPLESADPSGRPRPAGGTGGSTGARGAAPAALPGLYRMVLAAAPGTGGQALHVGVRYQGALIGARDLPIGADLWTTRGDVEARGGCGLAGDLRRPGGQRAALAPSFGAILLALGLLSARRARGSAGKSGSCQLPPSSVGG